jgi:hypothetical protein
VIPDHEGAKVGLTRRVRMLDAYIVLLSTGALILVGPLRSTLATLPLIPFLSTFLLFMVPGVLLSHWFLDEHLSGPAMVPVSFAISAGIFGLLGVPVLILHQSLDLYLWIAGALLSAFLVAAAFRVLRRKTSAENGTPGDFRLSSLWIPFLLLSTVLAVISCIRVPLPYDDIWVYLAWVQEFLSTDKLALYEPYFGNEIGASRVLINGWLLEQAAFSRVSGIDPVELVLNYLDPTLVVVSLLAFYVLARLLLRSEAAALMAGSLYALFFLIHLDTSLLYLDSGLLKFGWDFTGRIAEDKFTARYIFLPVALAFAVLFLESKRLRYLGFFALVCWSVMAVHPVGLAIIGLSMAGFGLIYLAVNRRKREDWTKMVSLGVALLSVLFVPALYVLTTGNPLTAVLSDADINSTDPDVLSNMVFVREEWDRVLELGEGSYIMHPSLLLDPVILVAFLLGLPFLLWRLKSSLAAQLLVGVLLLATVVCYVPPIATFVGDRIVLPGQLWRLAWPIPLAALLTLGWMAWAAARRAEVGLSRFGIARRVTWFVPLVLVVVLVAAATPASVAGAKYVYETSKAVQGRAFCLDPTFRWIGSNIKEPSVVFAPDEENTCIPAYSAQANVLTLRSGPVLIDRPALAQRTGEPIVLSRSVQDTLRFFYFPTSSSEIIRIVRRYEVDYVMVHANSARDEQLERLTGFIAINTLGDQYRLYAVDRQKISG